MGTRNLTCVVKDGEYKIAQYGQWDGYIGGVGRDLMKILQSILKEDKIDVLVKKINLTKEVTEDELKAAILSCGGREDENMGLLMDVSASDNYEKNFPSLHRNTSGGKLIEIVMEAEETVLINKDLEFAADSLFCEWCYVIDLDKRKLEVYRGFNKESLSDNERFCFLKEATRNEYNPVKFFAEITFDELKEVDIDKVVEEMENKKREYEGD